MASIAIAFFSLAVFVAKAATKVVVVTPEKIITKTVMQNVQLPDSDRDGIPDEADLYPKIPEQLMVKDVNLDGIDDRYDLRSPQ
jgi:hypothetical protein